MGVDKVSFGSNVAGDGSGRSGSVAIALRLLLLTNAICLSVVGVLSQYLVVRITLPLFSQQLCSDLPVVGKLMMDFLLRPTKSETMHLIVPSHRPVS